MLPVRYTRNLFLRGICIIYLSAFLSFYVQIPGLYGNNGILPARTQLNFESHASLNEKFSQKPTLIWFAPYLGINVEYMLDLLSLFGITLAFLGFVSQKFCISPVFIILWLLYYSLHQIGQIFMKYQWDSLLLETGFLCIFIAPLLYSRNNKRSTPSDTVTFWTVRWLLFRLIFSTGAGKLISQCPSWWKLNALNTYFESQCIPTALAWYAHHLPVWILRFTTVLTNVIEIVIPFLFFFPNRLVRVTAFYLQVFLQVFIIVTGNYNFYNFLIICLCISLLDDRIFNGKKYKNNNVIDKNSVLLCIMIYTSILYGMCVYYNVHITNNWTIETEIAFTQKQFNNALSYIIPISIYIGIASLGYIIINTMKDLVIISKGTQSKAIVNLVTILYTAAVCLIFTLSIVPYVTLNPPYNLSIPSQIQKLYTNVEHLHLVNSYGSYRPMKDISGRPEIIIEGSNTIDGSWKEYEFLYKPGNVNNVLPFVAPHQPRLDWQMCFAASSTYHQNPWLMSLAFRLLNGQPEALALINTVENPFNIKPPKYIKASLYHYYYVPWNDTQSNAQAWWTREKVEEYMPIFARDHVPLIEYLSKKKLIQEKTTLKITNERLKSILDAIRRLVSKVEASLFLWGVHTAGWGIMLL
uniref:lipase maturation factor 2-like n=1 Tax=Vespula vulgaris TaxID=7454 RepID=UPI0021425E9A|nr:lipase maturation factor 2-like [Vespula vulgaris]